MRVSKRQLKRIIRQEKRRILENCGGTHDPGASMAAGPALDLDPLAAAAPDALLESETPEKDMLVEMEVASRALEQVVESVQNAAQLCSNCVPEVAASAPIVEALSTQAEALQEMLEAQAEVIQENLGVVETPLAGPTEAAPVVDALLDVVAERRRRQTRRR